MIELPEAYTLAKQLTEQTKGQHIQKVVAGHSPHKLCWFYGDAEAYDALLSKKKIGDTNYFGGHVEMEIQEMRLDLHDGVNLQLFPPNAKLPSKHQLLVQLGNGSTFIGRVQMYGGISAFEEGALDNPYYLVAKSKPSPLSDSFNEAYFQTILEANDLKKLSAKAFLATEQRIPGLGNGTLQDILWNAGVHPKSKMAALSNEDLHHMYLAVKGTLRLMAEQGGRDTEKDLFGNPGGYKTVMSKNNREMTCPACGGGVKKETYMGGNVYVCPACQPIKKQ